MSIEELEKQVNAGIRQYSAATNEVWKLIGSVKKSDLDRESRSRLLEQLYSPLSEKDIRHTFAGDVARKNIGVSFRSCISHTRHWKKALADFGWTISPGGNSKSEDHEFAKSLGVRTPKVFGSSLRLDDLELRPGTVIKPEAGAAANGVFWIGDDKSLWSFATKTRYENIEEAKTELKSKKLLEQPVWKIEELVEKQPGVPAHDFKVWMFYGEVGLIQEIERAPLDGDGTAYFYHRPDGSEFKVNGARKKLVSAGVPDGIVEAARKISLAAPVPYLRVDFLAGSNNYCLGEITPHPGGAYAGQIFDEADKELGEMFIKAEARLYTDLLNGKSFPEFFNCYSTGNIPKEDIS